MDKFRSALQSLQVLIESELGVAAVVVVASATASDGSDAVARGIAATYADQGVRAAFVSTDGHAVASIGADAYDTLVVADSARHSSAGFRQLVDAWREKYDVVIIDGAVLGSNNKAMQIARSADGVLFTVRAGRSVKREDTEMAALTERLGAKVLGVIETSGRMPKIEFAAAKATTVHSGVRTKRDSAFSRA